MLILLDLLRMPGAHQADLSCLQGPRISSPEAVQGIYSSRLGEEGKAGKDVTGAQLQQAATFGLSAP